MLNLLICCYLLNLLTSHNLTVLSSTPETSVFPSGLIATDVVSFKRAKPPILKFCIHFLFSRHHNFMMLPDDDEAKVFPSELKATYQITKNTCAIWQNREGMLCGEAIRIVTWCQSGAPAW